MTKIHPALAEHALLKNSELHQRIAELEAQVAALSQQAEAAGFEWPKLDKPAKVGPVRFNVGVSSRTVVEAAQRRYEYEVTPQKEAERIAAGHASIAAFWEKAMAEPAPAQDELRKRFDEIEDEVARGKHTAASVFTQMRTAAMYIRPAQTEQQPVAWGAFHFGGRRSGKLYSHCETEQQIDSYIADVHRSNDSITLRKAPLYAAPIKQTAPVPDVKEKL